MKKIILLTLTLLFSILGYSQFPTPGIEGFEGTTGPDLPAPTTPSAWTLGTGATGNQWAVFDNGIGLTRRWNITSVAANIYSGVNSAYMDRENIGAGNSSEDYLATPLVTIPANGQLRFWTRSTQNGANPDSQYIIKINSVAGTQTTLANYNINPIPASWSDVTLSAAYNVYEEKVVDLSSFAGQQVYIAFVLKNTQSTGAVTTLDRWLIDGVKIVQRCLEPTNLSATNISQTTAELSWINPSGSTSWEIEVTNTTPTGSGVIYNGALPYIASGLLPSTGYVYYVRSLCSNSSSNWVGPFNFSTSSPGLSCTAPIVITTLPYSTTDNTSNYGDTTDTTQPAACAGTATNYMTGNDVFYSYTPATTGTISITMTPNDNWSGIFVYQGCPNVGVTCVAGVANNGSGVRSIPSLSVTAGLPYIIVISSNATPQTIGYSLLIQQVNCPQPNNLSATNLGQTTASLSWGNPGAASSWQIVVQSLNAGIPTGAGTTTTVNTNYSVSGLTSATAYEYYVRADCNNGTFSAWSGPFPFNTNICDVAQQCSYTFRLTDTFGDGWNGNTISVRQNGIEVALLGPTFTTGTGPINIVVPMCNNLPFELYWNTGGFFANEIGVSIINSFSQTIFTKPPGTGSQNSSIFSGTVDCLTPVCLPPSNLTATFISQTSATLGWTTSGPESSWEIIVLPANSPAPLPNNPLWTAAPNNPTIVSGLTSGTSYDFYVRPICSATNTGAPSIVHNFNTTICPPANQCNYSFTMTDTFGDGWNGNTMSIIQNGIVVATIGSTFTTGNGPIVIQVPLCHGIPFSLQWNAGGNFANEVGVSIQEALTPQATIYTKAPGTGAQGTILYTGTAECFLPTCPKPINLTATSVTQTSAILGWFEQGTATAWEIYLVPFGQPAPTPTSLGIATTNPYLISSLPAGTAYTFYVRAKCSPTDVSLWSQPLTFGTLPVNDECSTASFAIVNQNLNCVQTTPGTLIGATQSLPAVNCPPGVANDDVWYTFTATAATHIISFNNVTPANTDLDYAIFQGSNCGSLTQLSCNTGAGLTAGVTYYIRIYSASATQQLVNFNLCIGTLPCTEAPAFCTGQTVTYANSTNVPSLGQIGCLFTSPNPAFFFLQVNAAGPLSYLISQVDNNGIPRDVDYVAWGPFSDLNAACSGVPQNPLPGATPIPTPATGCPGTLHACSYSTAPQEIICIPNAQLCEVYVIMITNFSNQAGNVTFTQTNNGGGTTSCFPINTFNYPLTTYCQDGVDPTPVLAPAAAAGTYSSTPGLVINPTTGTIDLSASTPGAYVITSTTATTVGGPCNNIPAITTTRTVIITAPSNATIAYSNPAYCNNVSSVQQIIRTGTSGGSYSSTPSGLSIDTNTGNIVPSASIPGVYTVTYLIAASGGCPLFTTQTTVTIIATPVIAQVANVVSCGNYVLPNISVGNYYTSANGTGTLLPSGTVISSNQTVYIHAESGTSPNCISDASFTITISTGAPDSLPNVTSCDSYILPALSANNNYYTGSLGTGTLLTAGSLVTSSQTLYINYQLGSCNSDTSFVITINTTPTIAASVNVTACDSYTLPSLTSGNYYTASGGTGTMLIAGTAITTTQTIYVYSQTGTTPNCFVQNSFVVTINTTPTIATSVNVTACDSYTLPTLTSGNYYTASGGTGTMLIAGTAITTTQTIYVYSQTGTTPNCFVENSFVVTINTTPTIAASVNVTACDSYTLPTLTSGNYYTASGGNGTMLIAGTAITTTQTIYVYAQTGTTPNCFVENSFVVTINTTPTIAASVNVTACDSYTLPTLTSGNYYTASGGNGTMLIAGTAITTTQTIYVYAQTGTTPNCFVENSFVVTINTTPTIAASVNVTACDSYTLPTLTSGNYYTSSGGTGTMLTAGTVITTTKTIYVYAQTGTTPNCSVENSFVVTINVTPTIAPSVNVNVCDSYTLPALTSGNYYTASGGTGTMLPAGTTVTTSQTIYVYAQTGTTPNCFVENSFTVNITLTPVINPIADVDACNSYTLPTPAVGNYFTGQNGTGTQITLPATLTTSQTLYVYAHNGTCSDQEAVTITITPSPIFTMNGGCQGSIYIVETVAVNFNPNTASYTWLNPSGTIITGATNSTLEVSPSSPGQYTCIVTIPNGTGSTCSNNGIFNANDVTCSIPRGISPNNDQTNDTFDLTGLNVKQLSIYNRYGTKVYSKTNYVNEWSGLSDSGNELPDGTYYYVIERDNVETKTGWVYINREIIK